MAFFSIGLDSAMLPIDQFVLLLAFETGFEYFQVQSSIFERKKNKMSKSCCGVQVCADVCKYCGLSSSYKIASQTGAELYENS